MRIISGLVLLGLAVSACSGGGDPDGAEATGTAATSAEASSSSGISETYSEYFDAAWKEAGEGISPTNNCARIFGMAVGLVKAQNIQGQELADAVKAMDACYIGAMARFVDVKLSGENVGMAECRNIFTTLRAHRGALGSFLEDVGEDQAAYDGRLNERIGDKVRSACPDLADGILGT
ncbi:MAG: hypothetical protein ACR2O7_01880 [Parasphingorhabdus sp.]